MLGMLNVPSEFPEPATVWNEPFGCGTSAIGNPGTFVQSIELDTAPVVVHAVIIKLPLTVPAGVTLQFCVALPPAFVAVTEN